jgi:hypothetical protein
MAPYKVAVIPTPEAAAIELIVPAGDDLTIASLVEAALKRASKHSSSPLATSDTTELRLNSPSGYHVDADDKLVDVLSPGDVLVIVLARAPIKDLPLQTKIQPQKLTTPGTDNIQFQIRVITPSAAVQHADVRQISLLKGGQVFSNESTLREIKEAVCDHFQLNTAVMSIQKPHNCNCKLAEQLLERGNWHKHTCGGHRGNIQCDFQTTGSALCARCSNPMTSHESLADDDGTCRSYVLFRQDLPCGHTIHSSCIESDQGHWYCPKSCQSASPADPNARPKHCVIISGAHHVETIELEDSSMIGILTSLRHRLGENFEATQCVHAKGGVEGYGGGYTVLPIVSVCSIANHKTGPDTIPTLSALPPPSLPTLDLHTAESPLNTQYLDQTVSQVGLSDLVVNGILCLYALSRQESTKSVKRVGKTEMYTADPHW